MRAHSWAALGDGLEVAHQEPRTERDEEGRIGEDERPRRVAELEGANDIRERDEEQRRRHQVGHEDARADGTRHGELEAPEGIAREEPAEERDQRRHARDEERVPQPAGERRLRHQVAEVLQRRRERPERRVVHGAPGAIELGVGADGGDQHPIEREQRADDEHGQRDVEVHPLLPPALYDHRSEWEGAPAAAPPPYPPTSSRSAMLGARRRNPARAMRRVQLRGGARWPHARRTRVGGVRGHVWAPQTKIRRFDNLARGVARRSRDAVPPQMGPSHRSRRLPGAAGSGAGARRR